MKKKKLKKGLVVAVLLMIVMTLGSLIAFLTDGDIATNTFIVGKVSIDLQEPNWDENNAKNITPNLEVQKDPQILNDGENPAYVFLEVKVPYGNLVMVNNETGEKALAADTELWSYTVKDGWVEIGTPNKDEDSGMVSHFYVYGTSDNCTELASGDSTSTLFDYVRFANAAEDQGLEGEIKDIIINAYAIQTDNIYDGKSNLDGNNADGKVDPLGVLDVILKQFPTIDNKVHLGAMLMVGPSFNATIPNTATAVVFCDEVAPEGSVLTDVSEEQNEGVVAWMDGSTYKVSTQNVSKKVLANPDSSKMFYNKPKLESLTFNNFDSYYITTLECAFAASNPSKASKITTLDLTGWDVSNVTNMKQTFQLNLNLTNLDVSNWNTGNVKTMDRMFYTSPKLKTVDVSNWDVSNVENFNFTFAGHNSYPSKLEFVDVSKWDTSSATNMHCMFYQCDNLNNIDVSNWKTSKVTDMFCMFAGYNVEMILEELDVSKWDTSSVINMEGMFQKCSNLTTLDVKDWDTSSVTDMSYMFNKCPNLSTLDVSNWNTSSVTDMGYMFNMCPNLSTLDVSNWNTSNVTDMSYMFNGCENLVTLDISKWDMEKVQNTRVMFQECKKLDINIPSSLKVLDSFSINHVEAFSKDTFTISKNVNRIGKSHIFYNFGTDNFRKFIVEDENEYFKTIDDCLYTADGTRLISIPRGKTFENNTLELPEGLTFMNELSFSRNQNIYKLILPNSYELKYYDDTNHSDYDGDNLNTGSSLQMATYLYTGIKEYAVKEDNPNYTTIDGCLYTKDSSTLLDIPLNYVGVINIPDGVTSIHKYAFGADRGTKITEINIPSTVTDIGEVFMDKINSWNIQITVDSENPNYTVIDGKLASK